MKNTLFILFILISVSNFSFAQVPNNFSPGDPVSASQINSNFQYLYNLMMGNKVKNMLICEKYGRHQNINNYELFFYNCFSSDTSVLKQIAEPKPCSSSNCFSEGNGIISKDIIDNKWALFDFDDGKFVFFQVE